MTASRLKMDGSWMETLLSHVIYRKRPGRNGG